MAPIAPSQRPTPAVLGTPRPRPMSELENQLTIDAPLSHLEATEEPKLPTVDDANYINQTEIARGGMGKIVAAQDRRLGRPVALKVLLEPAGDALGRFEREALITARLQHPGIIPVYEAGRWPSGEPFFSMKHVAGRPLDRVIGELRTLEDRLALLPRIAAAADAIAYAHSQRIVHRDLKPGNVLIGEFGETVVIDWGLAKDLDAGEDSVQRVPERKTVRAMEALDPDASEPTGEQVPSGRGEGTEVGDRKRLVEIPGMVPSLHELPQGCKFADRCPAVQADCREAEPALTLLGKRAVRCHHPLEAPHPYRSSSGADA